MELDGMEMELSSVTGPSDVPAGDAFLFPSM
jgi:hypothetical protein